MQEVITKKINEKITPKSEDVTEISWLAKEEESPEIDVPPEA